MKTNVYHFKEATLAVALSSVLGAYPTSSSTDARFFIEIIVASGEHLRALFLSRETRDAEYRDFIKEWAEYSTQTELSVVQSAPIMTSKLEEVYEHRCALFIALCAQFPDKVAYLKSDPAWLCVYLTLPLTNQQISYHVPVEWESTLMRMQVKKAQDGYWDRHTSDDVVKRLRAYAYAVGPLNHIAS